MEQEKLLKWCEEHFNFDTQKWEYEYIPNEILDCIITVRGKWWPRFENEYNDDFVIDFVYSEIEDGKQWKIIKMLLKERFEEETKDLFD